MFDRNAVARQGYSYWSPLTGLGADVPAVPDSTYLSRIDTYINTVDWKYQNLKNSGADAKFPADMSNIRVGLYTMQNLRSQAGTMGAEKAEMAAQKVYKATVQTETDVARKLTMQYPTGTFATPEQVAAPTSWWSGAVESATPIPDVQDTPMQAMLTKPDLSSPIGQAVAQAQAAVQQASGGGGVMVISDLDRKVVRTADGGCMVVDGKGNKITGLYCNPKTLKIEPRPSTFPWLAVGLGLAGVAAAYYFFIRRRGS
jgi:hypothetical protein